MRRVFDERQAMPIGQRAERRHLDRPSAEVHRHDRPCARGHGRGRRGRRQVPGGGIDVGKARRRAGVDGDVGRRAEGERRRDHLVARSDLERQQRQMQGRGARVQRQRMRRAGVGGKRRLELPYPRSGREPARLERGDDLVDLATADDRRRKAHGGRGGRRHQCRASLPGSVRP